VRLNQEIRLLTGEGLQPIQYPLETLHEIITNAVLHRDYGIADDIHVRIFDNRVEVESPGRLPAHITEYNILDERFSRNGTIVRFINKFPDPPNKDVGEGLNTAFTAMKKLKLRDPIIRQTDNAVVVEIRHQRLGSPEEIIMGLSRLQP
jgi:ATP-dependent DNA helicase RecG